MSVTYGQYLELDNLLQLQRPRSEPEEHDETLFIIIHQVYELWFKQILHELTWLQDALESNRTPVATATLKRILTIFKTLVSQIDVLETMTPVSFLSFRARIESASGFQSAQFREVEFLLGHRPARVLKHYPADSPHRLRLEELATRPSLWDSFLRYLAHQGKAIPEKDLQRDPGQQPRESSEVQEVLIQVYRFDPLVGQVCELLVDLDEGLQEWRYRHVKMVERTIGSKQGSGGSAGVEYLKKTLFQPLFPDLWAIRGQL